VAEDNENKAILGAKLWEAAEMVVLPIDVPNVYSNNVQIRFTNWDMALVFGEIAEEQKGTPDAPGDKLIIRPRIRVTMSHAHAKAFLEVYQATFAAFEKSIGEIKIVRPEDVAATREGD
jgi:uncharacterized protein DUF3467